MLIRRFNNKFHFLKNISYPYPWYHYSLFLLYKKWHLLCALCTRQTPTIAKQSTDCETWKRLDTIECYHTQTN